jgi:hypothetical protein
MRSKAKRKIVKAGRRGGKTYGAAILAGEAFINGLRVLYGAPTIEQVDAFWYEVTKALENGIEAKVFRKNETEHTIEIPGTKQRIKAKTCWNADSLRGDYADLLILDEFQLMDESAWRDVGAPMLADNNGDAVFIFTPPSLQAAGVSKARDPRHASKLYKKALEDTTGMWEAFHFTSFDNPYISNTALNLLANDMSLDSYRREIMAEDDEIENSWLVFGKFNEQLCKIKRFDIPKNWEVYSGHDFGSANPAALFIARVKLPLPPGAPQYMRHNDWVCFREYAPGAGYSTAQHVERFKELTTGYQVTKRVGGNQTTEDEIRQGYNAHGWTITAPHLSKVNAQLDRTLSLIELNKLFIFGDMLGLLTQIANCMWELDDENHTRNKIKDEAKYHLIAALRYIASDFTPETVIDQSPRIKRPAYTF